MNYRIRKVTVSTGIITTIAGTGTNSYSGDNGAATSATFNSPVDVALDSAGISLLYKLFYCLSKTYFTILSLGNVYIADLGSQRIRKVTASTGIITTYAGSSTSGSYSGDNSAATIGTLSSPYGVALDLSGNFICNSFFLRGFTSSFPTSSPR